MKYYLLILFICKILSTQSELEQIDNSKFGKSLLDTINLQLNARQGVNEVMKVLDEMRDTMNEQKEKYEQEHQRFQQYCAKDIDFYEREIAESTVNIVDIQREIDKQQEEISVIYNNLNQTQEQQKVYKDALGKLNEIRLEQYRAFKDSMDEHDITTSAIEQAKRYFVQIRGDISFLQTKKNVLVQLTSHFQDTKTRVKSQARKALFHILAEITNKAAFDNNEVVTKILELCNRVLENLQESRMEEEEEEQERVKLFEEKKAQIEDNIAKLQKIIDNFMIQLMALQENLKINAQYREEQINRKQENSKLYDSRKSECNFELSSYGDQRQKQLSQIQTVEQVITLTETKLAVMKQYLTERREKYAKF